jgi:tetratricopeptide (TPR) repeat protein
MRKIFILGFLLIFPVSFCQEIADHLMKAKALSIAGNHDEAIERLTLAIGSLNDYRYFLQRAEAFAGKGDYSSAINDFQEANMLVPSSGEYGLARIYSHKGDVQTSLYHLELNLTSEWKKSEKEIMLDPAFANIENKSEWRNFWRKEHYSELERKVSEIEFYTSSGKIDEAKILLSELRSVYPHSDKVLYSEALINLSSGKAGETARIIESLTRQQNVNEKYLRLLADAQVRSSNPAGASVTYSRLLQSGVADAGLLLARAECYMKTGENGKATADLEKYLDLYPDDMTALRIAGKTQAASGDNFKALELFSKNLELHPNEAELYIDRGNSYLAAKSWEWAARDYSMSLDLKPGNSDAWLNKGIALLNSGKKEAACFDFRKALRLGNKRASEFINKNCIK